MGREWMNEWKNIQSIYHLDKLSVEIIIIIIITLIRVIIIKNYEIEKKKNKSLNFFY